MATKIRIPTPLRKLTAGAAEISAEGATVGELIEALELAHPGIRDRLLEPSGAPRRFINIYVDGEDIRFLNGLQTPVAGVGEVSIVPAMAGGE